MSSIKGGTIVTADLTYKADVKVEGGKIVEISPNLSGDETLDATGCYVMPGGIDPHTHLEMPFMGTYSSDDFESGTRAALAGAKAFTLPTAGNAGVAASAYGARAGIPVRVFAPKTTPETLLAQIVAFGGDLHLVDGHIGDCGRASRRYATESGAFDLSTLREPYRIEGKKTLGLELAEQLDWQLPDAILYPTGGGTGLIGMWKAFLELRDAGWLAKDSPLPRMFTVQSSGCAPIVKAFESGRDSAEAWSDPWTVASGLRVPGPLGDRLMLKALRESGGGVVAVNDGELSHWASEGTRLEGVDFSPEGGATLAAARLLLDRNVLRPEHRVVLFNTGAGWLYRSAAELPGS